jgi:TRAP-type C4-dicarboxylate transport system permease small subunit
MKQIFTDDASASVIMLFIVTIFLGLLVWAGTGLVVDKIVDTQNGMITSDLPMSQDRLNTTNWLILGFRALPVLGITIPMIIYSIGVARRRDDSVVM